MDVFFSWSGSRSKELATVFKKWLPCMIQAIKPYFSPDDLEKGMNWSVEISKKLSDCKYGILFVTPENQSAPWLLFEAGAIAKEVSSSRVCPILFNIPTSNVSGPLSLLQLTKFEKLDIKKLVEGLNSKLGEDRLSEATLDQTFEMIWPKLEEDVQKLLSQEVADSPTPPRSEREILVEILELSRITASKLKDSSHSRHLEAMVNELLVEKLFDRRARSIRESLISNYDEVINKLGYENSISHLEYQSPSNMGDVYLPPPEKQIEEEHE